MPPEVRRYVEAEGTAPGRALDLGCGTGTSAVYLALRGWETVGLDFAPRAIERARRRAAEAGVTARFLTADVTELPDLGAPFDLALDIGCLHAVPAARRERYVAGLARATRPGATYLVYAFLPQPRRPGIARTDIERMLAKEFELARYEEGKGRPSAWYRFTRREGP